MRPMFTYYGSKWNLVGHFGPPRSNMVVEPFAGSASYSLYWNATKVKLFDIDDEVCAIWDFLINSSANEIKELPDWIESIEQLDSIPNPANLLIRRWIWFLPNVSRCRTMNRYFRDREMGRRQWGGIWSPVTKQRILRQKPFIKNWTIQQSDYRDIPNECAHWHIDPPYYAKAGRAYRFNTVNYKHLAEWCKSRQGTVDVCEMEGADWLEFKPLHKVVNTGRRKYTEMFWSSDNLGRLI